MGQRVRGLPALKLDVFCTSCAIGRFRSLVATQWPPPIPHCPIHPAHSDGWKLLFPTTTSDIAQAQLFTCEQGLQAGA